MQGLRVPKICLLKGKVIHFRQLLQRMMRLLNKLVNLWMHIGRHCQTPMQALAVAAACKRPNVLASLAVEVGFLF